MKRTVLIGFLILVLATLLLVAPPTVNAPSPYVTSYTTITQWTNSTESFDNGYPFGVSVGASRSGGQCSWNYVSLTARRGERLVGDFATRNVPPEPTEGALTVSFYLLSQKQYDNWTRRASYPVSNVCAINDALLDASDVPKSGTYHLDFAFPADGRYYLIFVNFSQEFGVVVQWQPVAQRYWLATVTTLLTATPSWLSGNWDLVLRVTVAIVVAIALVLVLFLVRRAVSRKRERRKEKKDRRRAR